MLVWLIQRLAAAMEVRFMCAHASGRRLSWVGRRLHSFARHPSSSHKHKHKHSKPRPPRRALCASRECWACWPLCGWRSHWAEASFCVCFPPSLSPSVRPGLASPPPPPPPPSPTHTQATAPPTQAVSQARQEAGQRPPGHPAAWPPDRRQPRPPRPRRRRRRPRCARVWAARASSPSPCPASCWRSVSRRSWR